MLAKRLAFSSRRWRQSAHNHRQDFRTKSRLSNAHTNFTFWAIKRILVR
jgi:hypothetical protein